MSSENSWPDLVGMNAEEAKNIILESYPNLNVFFLVKGNLLQEITGRTESESLLIKNLEALFKMCQE